jgi:hypothetical protein
VAKTPAAPLPSDEQAGPAGSGKGRPTPTRAEQEAVRRRPLVPDTKAQGDEKYLPVRDKGPQRRFVRDYVDGGWHLAEFVMPAMIVVILLTFINIPVVQFYSFVALWGFILLVILDMVLTSVRAKRAVRRKFGESKL